ncbi:MAG: 5-(carboxyamino)imidazole ribonucleotide mutase [Clostridia bacterium]|nr:5-(carboxyamino)imidazole ribonucleotide mutase [Clostridia bacterium]
MKKIALIMGSDSDLKVVEKAIDVLQAFEAEYEVHVFSAHRTPEQVRTFAETAHENGFGVIIAAAGMAAHLAGAVAAASVLPVIAIPISAKHLEGMDALLSSVMMPPGIPVACVGIDGAKNAALLALQILAVNDSALYEKLRQNRAEAARLVLEKDAAITQKYKHI